MKSLSRPQLRRLGPLDVLEFAASEDSPAILCLHGYGANSADLAPLAAELELPGPAKWAFPDAPLGLPQFAGGRAWFPINEEALMRAQMTGEPVDLSAERPP